MSLTLLMLTVDGAQKISRVLPRIADIADELVIGIDATTTDNTEAVARRFTDRVFMVPHSGFCGSGRADHVGAVEYMLQHCRGDWVLRIDHDETLSPHWHDRSYVRRLLTDRCATHAWIPRRWLVPPGDLYISNRHWQPDHQLRLFRNIPSLIRFNKKAHEPPVIVGEPRYLADCWIEHWDYVWHNRAVREQKVRFYASLNVYTGEEYYLYEDQSFETKPLSHTQTVSISNEHNIGISPFAAEVRILDRPKKFRRGELEPLVISITNRSSRAFLPGDGWSRPPNVAVSYHWFEEDGRVLQWDYDRSSTAQPIFPGESALMFLRVLTPDRPGTYLVQPDLVEEHVAWFSEHCAIETSAVVVE
ncbi:MAG: glycosyltransferase [Terriglobia bacterium]